MPGPASWCGVGDESKMAEVADEVICWYETREIPVCVLQLFEKCADEAFLFKRRVFDHVLKEQWQSPVWVSHAKPGPAIEGGHGCSCPF